MAAMATVSHGDRSIPGPRGLSREGVRHLGAAPEVASVEIVPSASARSLPGRPAARHREWTLDAFTTPRITDLVIRWELCIAIPGACL